MTVTLLRPRTNSGALHIRLLTSALLLSALITAASCSGPEEHPLPPLGRFVVLSQAQAPGVALQQVKTTPLGSSQAEAPFDINDVATRDDSIFVADYEGRAVKIYGPTGLLLRTITSTVSARPPFDHPEQIAVSGDTIYVLDAGHGEIALVSFDGRRLGTVPLPAGMNPTSFALSAQGLIISTNALAHESLNSVLFLAPRSGRLTQLKCQADPSYIESKRSNRMLRVFAFTRATVTADGVACSQPITPILQLLSADGTVPARAYLAPPFYRSPTDRPMSTNAKQLANFRATWTPQFVSFRRRAGFVSAYVTYDSVTQHRNYLMFACDSLTASSHCETASVPGAPLALLGTDTLLVALLPPAVDRPSVGWYVVPRP